jgi:hypothetical protein
MTSIIAVQRRLYRTIDANRFVIEVTRSSAIQITRGGIRDLCPAWVRAIAHNAFLKTNPPPPYIIRAAGRDEPGKVSRGRGGFRLA